MKQAFHKDKNMFGLSYIIDICHLIFISVALMEIYYFCAGSHSGTVICCSITIVVLTLAVTTLYAAYIYKQQSSINSHLPATRLIALFSGSLASTTLFIEATLCIVQTTTVKDNTAKTLAYFITLSCAHIFVGLVVLAVTFLAVRQREDEKCASGNSLVPNYSSDELETDLCPGQKYQSDRLCIVGHV